MTLTYTIDDADWARIVAAVTNAAARNRQPIQGVPEDFVATWILQQALDVVTRRESEVATQAALDALPAVAHIVATSSRKP
jgi:hypothetical protein